MTMDSIDENTITEIMTALDNGLSVDQVYLKFPNHIDTIKKIVSTKDFLKKVEREIKIPVINFDANRILSTDREGRPNNLIINFLLTMNYKFILPVIIGLVLVAGGSLLYFKHNNNNRTNSDLSLLSPNTNTSQIDNNSVDGDINNIENGLLESSNAEQQSNADDGLNPDMFAQSELSNFESDNYDF